jgi:signal transduction histidine kinase/ActR/RegA family two-component response regulator
MPHLRLLIDALAGEPERTSAARAIAEAVGARELAIYLRDQELGLMLPAPGMRKTVDAGPSWRALLHHCVHDGEVDAQVEVGHQSWHAHAVSKGGCAAILLADAPCEFPQLLREAMPLLGAMLLREQDLQLGRAQAAESREAARRAHQLARALDAARASAAELNRQLRTEHQRKDEFLAMLAHELRNPLAPVVSGVEILKRTPPADVERHRRTLEVMTRQLQQLTHLVDDLLEVSRVTRGLIELRREVLRVDELLSAAADASRPLIDSRRHTLQMDCRDADLHVSGDRVRLVQVFSNLLTNAAKYTPPGGMLRVETSRCGADVCVRVIDNGVGIPPEMLESVFEMFTQVPGSLDRAPGGLGIGLTLVRNLVELHGGHVHASSEGADRGSVFTVCLAALDAPAVRGDQELPAATRVEQAIHVLVVDDNVDAAESLAEVLRMMGAKVNVAHDGASALRLREESDQGAAPGLVLLDLGLPGMDGYETAREWRRRFGSATKLVALTGYGSPEDRRRTAEAGFDGHLVKPVSVDEIRSLMDAVLQAEPRSAS